MNRIILKERVEVLAQVIILTSKLYRSKKFNESKRGFLETLIGAGIWYLPSGKELFSGKISEKALEKIKTGKGEISLVKEHGFPRKVAGQALYTKHLDPLKKDFSILQELYISKMGKYNLVLGTENGKLKKYQRVSKFISEKDAYKDAGIKLVKITEELYNDYPVLKKYRFNDKKTSVNPGALKKEPGKLSKSELRTKQLQQTASFSNIEINGLKLLGSSNNNPTDCYRAFMTHIIKNYPKQISKSRYFKKTPNDQSFGKAVKNKRVETLSGLSYSTYMDTKSKKAVINSIAGELGLRVKFQ